MARHGQLVWYKTDDNDKLYYDNKLVFYEKQI